MLSWTALFIVVVVVAGFLEFIARGIIVLFSSVAMTVTMAVGMVVVVAAAIIIG